MPQNTSVLTRTHFTELRSKYSPPETPSRQEPKPEVMAMPVQETGTNKALDQRGVTQAEGVPA